MDKEDARYQTLGQLHERRKQVIRLHRQGYGVMQIAQLCGLSYPTVRRAIDCYTAGGLSAIAPSGRGRKSGDGRILSPQQEDLIQAILWQQPASESGVSHAVWSRIAVMELIEKKCGIQVSVRAVGNYLKRWNFAPQKPSQALSLQPSMKNQRLSPTQQA